MVMSYRPSGTAVVMLVSTLLVQTSQALKCVPVVSESGYCSGLMPKKVCAVGNQVDGSGYTLDRYEADKDVTCPKNPALFTKKIFCQGPWLPCVEDSDCSKSTSKRCFALCMNGGVAAGRTFLGANQCAKDMYPSTYCNARVQAGEVAAPGETHCIGLSDFQNNHGRLQFGHTPWIPEVCTAKFPLYDYQMVDFGKAKRKEFMLALAEKVNKFWGYENNTDETKFTRGTTLKASRIQVKNEVITIFVEAQQFCLAPMRQGKWLWTEAHGKATNEYCDVPGVTPRAMLTNLSLFLDSKPEEEGMMVGEGFTVHKTYRTQPAVMPDQCYMWSADDDPDIPEYVWALVSVGSSLLLLSILILQHRYRNSITRVRNNQKLRNYD